MVFSGVVSNVAFYVDLGNLFAASVVLAGLKESTSMTLAGTRMKLDCMKYVSLKIDFNY
jgi:hypothetical protein